MNDLAPRTIDAFKKMAKVLHDAGAETKIVGDTEEFTLDGSCRGFLVQVIDKESEWLVGG